MNAESRIMNAVLIAIGMKLKIEVRLAETRAMTLIP